MTDILIIQHEDDVPAGTGLEWAQGRGLTTTTWHPAKGQPLPKMADFRALYICGGAMDVFEETKHPWLRYEKALIKEFIEAQKPIMGLCLGSQLIADVLGAKVYPLKKWEIGFVPITMKDELEPYTLQVMHWHQCVFELPEGAELLAEGDFWKNQAYRVGPKIVATQFHPESTTDWVKECADEVTDKYQGLVQNKDQMLASMSYQKPMQEWFFKTLDRWHRAW